MVGNMKGVLHHKNQSLWYKEVEYLEFSDVDYNPHSLEIQENTDEYYTHRNTAGIGGDTD